ncbi:unnamed protein product [Arabidopsis halleri]
MRFPLFLGFSNDKSDVGRCPIRFFLFWHHSRPCGPCLAIDSNFL